MNIQIYKKIEYSNNCLVINDKTFTILSTSEIAFVGGALGIGAIVGAWKATAESPTCVMLGKGNALFLFYGKE